jgi:hypothetical protein
MILTKFLQLPRRLDIPTPYGYCGADCFMYYLEIHHLGKCAEIGYYRPVSHLESGLHPEILIRVSDIISNWQVELAIDKIRRFLKEKNYLQYGSVGD